MLKYEIVRLKRPTLADVLDINILLPQQAAKPRFLTLSELKRIISQDCINMFVARATLGGKKQIVGMASVIFYRVPTGLIAFIEELTVDETFRGNKIGFRLVERLIKEARAKKAKHISTYTNPARLAANAVYQKLGFFRKETNFYRINIILPEPSSRKEIVKVLKYKQKRARLL